MSKELNFFHCLENFSMYYGFVANLFQKTCKSTEI